MTIPRTKGLSTKVTEDEYATFERLADGETLSEWTRDMLLKATATQSADPMVLAELLAFRTIVLKPAVQDLERPVRHRRRHAAAS